MPDGPPLMAGPYVSTGTLPSPEIVADLVTEAHRRYAGTTGGEVSRVYPALEAVPAGLFGICIVNTRGAAFSAGDAEVEFTIMSVAKPFVFALVCDAIGTHRTQDVIGVDATGLPFNSLAAVERGGGRTNPMVNAGAIATASLAPGTTAADRWAFIREGLSAFAGRTLAVDGGVYASASATNQRNQAIARLLHSYRGLGCDPDEATDRYTRQSCLRVTARDLAVMGATLADGGVNPITGVQVVTPLSARCTLAVMTTAGLYETSGAWLFDVGLPGKSGIGGGIVTVSPGKGGLGTFAPPLDAAGNSVRGQQAARFLAQNLGLDLFRSVAETGS